MINPVIKLASVGDIALTHDYDRLLAIEGSHYPFDKVRGLLKDYDIVIGNLEAPLSNRGQTYPLKCSLRSNPEYIIGLKDAGFNVFSLANNHILDYKEDAFYDTLEILDKNSIKYFGAGRNIKEARKPVILDIEDIKIGFLGYCDVVIDSPFYASENERGIAPLKIEYLEEDIVNLKKKADVVIVSLHWGMENYSYPVPNQIDVAHKIIDFGADLILGHHPHVLQGIEKYKNRYIAYSLGNFVFSDIHWTWKNKEGNQINSVVKLNKINRESIILTITLDKMGIKQAQAVPCLISESLQPVIKKAHLFLIKKIKKLSNKLYIKNYEVFYHRYSVIQKCQFVFLNNIRRIRKIHKFRIIHIRRFLQMLKS